jgi:hypothetical protein
VRASPTLSGAFLVAGAALIVISVFEGRAHPVQRAHPAPPDLSLGALQKSAAAAESEMERGQLRSPEEVVAKR